MATGSGHTCVLLDDRTVRCWGGNRQAQLGSGAISKYRTTPAAVAGLTDVVDILAYARKTCALRTDGAVLCWGANEYGDVSPTEKLACPTPVPVAGLAPATSISLGDTRSCAVLTDGSASCWGLAPGDGSMPVLTPRPVEGISGAVQMSMGGQDTCAVLQDGTLDCWGFEGAVAIGSSLPPLPPEPTVVVGLPPAVEIAQDGPEACARATGGDIFCWGYDSHGLLGTADPTDSQVPLQVAGVAGATHLSVAGETACALLPDGTIRCWGSNVAGLLATGATDFDRHPAPTALSLQGVQHLALAADHACAVTGDGHVWCWGANEDGQLGDGTILPRYAPVEVALDGCGPDAPDAPSCGQADPEPTCLVTVTDPSVDSLDASPMVFQIDAPTLCCEDPWCDFSATTSGDDGRGIGGSLTWPLAPGSYRMGSSITVNPKEARASLSVSALWGSDGYASQSWVAKSGLLQVITVDGNTVRLEATDIPIVPASSSSTPDVGVGTFKATLSCTFHVGPALCHGVPI